MFGPIVAVEFLRLDFPPGPPVNTRLANQVDGFLQTVAGVENHFVRTAILRRPHDFVMKDDEYLHDGINLLQKRADLQIPDGRSEISRRQMTQAPPLSVGEQVGRIEIRK